MAVRMNRLVQPPERFLFKISTTHREVGRTLSSRSPVAGGRDGGDGARQWMAAARARETRERGGGRSRSTVVKGIGLTG
jgi:hypothetical protein